MLPQVGEQLTRCFFDFTDPGGGDDGRQQDNMYLTGVVQLFDGNRPRWRFEQSLVQ
ncbi:MAG: hypothetical protein GY731_04170 [Gammaproteobacteria bacterium]|nr:hypothetical protein [Gammaproteobacteria bacterium]